MRNRKRGWHEGSDREREVDIEVGMMRVREVGMKRVRDSERGRHEESER